MGLEKIEEYKRKLGLTTAQLAEQSGVPKATLDKILSGVTTNPKFDTLVAIAEVLGCTLDDFADSQAAQDLDAESTFNQIDSLIARNGNSLTQEEIAQLIKGLANL